MKSHILTALLSVFLVPGLALADPWKDESGHGRRGPDEGWGERFGEPPPWARGKGYWDGHFKRGPAPFYRGRVFGPPIWRPYGFHPFLPTPYGRIWYGDDDDYEDWLEDRRERLEDLREQQREAYEEWHEWQRERGRFYLPRRHRSLRWR